jgi:hypothetical protein
MYCSEMPKIDLEALIDLTDDELELVKRIINPKTGCLRASKPRVARDHPYRSYNGEIEMIAPEPVSGKAAYLWRMVAFAISPIGQHHCMPVTAEWDLPVQPDGEHDFDARRAMAKELDALTDKVIKTVPLNQHYGTIRWGRALGYLG